MIAAVAQRWRGGVATFRPAVIDPRVYDVAPTSSLGGTNHGCS